MTGNATMHLLDSSGTRVTSHERGQILVLFALSLVAIVAMVGLVLDGGSAFAQRREQQNAADIAALAATNDLIVNQGSANWQATAQSMTAANGFANGVNGVTVQVSCVNCPGQVLDPASSGVQVTVDITGAHRNNFASIVGMPNWDVSTTATSKTGWQDTAQGPGPFIVSITAFDPVSGRPTTCTEAVPCELFHPVDDTPQAPDEFTWTDFGYDISCPTETGNVNDSDLQTYLDGQADFSITLEFGCYIAQHNAGVMDNIVRRIGDMAPITFPVPIVDAAGRYVGWATFVVEATVADGRNGTINGYFVSGAQNEQLDVVGAGFGNSIYGSSWEVSLVN
jgi:Flp pilus assembly protein TadG